jgi:4-hydroxy-tetrahydrodipicolinate reductase
MKAVLIGYGKMGKAIEKTLLEKGYPSPIIGKSDLDSLRSYKSEGAQVAIEFTKPDSAEQNITNCLKAGLPVVSGTTGWLHAMEQVKKTCTECNGSFFYASNFSIGVNILFHLNQTLANTMKRFAMYEPSIEEVHHIHKLDEPSGTAITLAEGIISEGKKRGWELEQAGKPLAADNLPIKAIRENEVPGTHHVRWESEIDNVTISHQAKSRKGFAEGAVLAASWLIGKNGTFGMSDLLDL